MGKKRKTWTDLLNQTDAFEIYQYLYNIALSRITWEGLPRGLNSYMLETNLIENGSVAFYYDKNLGMTVALPWSEAGTPNIYNLPQTIRLTGNNGYYSESIDVEDVVFLDNTFNRSATIDTIHKFTNKLYEVSRTCDVNVLMQKVPYLIACSEDDVASIRMLLSKVQDNELVCIGDKSLSDVERLEVLQTNAEFKCLDMSDYANYLMSEFLTRIGIDNTNIDKKERVNTLEVKSNNDLINLNRNAFIKSREKFLIEIQERQNNGEFLDIKGINFKWNSGGNEECTVTQTIEEQ